MSDNELVACPRCNYEWSGMRGCLLCEGLTPYRCVPTSLAVEYALVRSSPDFIIDTVWNISRLRERHGVKCVKLS